MSVQISTTFVLAFLALCLIGAPSGAYGQLKQNVGVVEGFYWTPSDAVNGQSGFFTFEQRLELFDVMAEGGLGVYYYAPQQVDSLGLWDANSVTKWTETATKASNLGISLVYGLRPGWLSGTWTEIHDKVQQLLDVGIHAYALNFDDAEGASSDEQKNRQVALASYLDQTFPTMNLRIFLPSEYWQTHDGPSTTKSQWAASLSIVDSGLDSSVAMGLTGHDITPSSMSTSDFPPLSSSRPKWFWDNWAAEDTSTKLPWGRISSSSNPRIDTTLFTAPSYGYVLNLAFPVERTVHQVYCLAQLIDPSITNPCTTSYLGTRWATWLSDHGFAHQHSTSSLANTLAQVIEDDPYTMTSISQLESTYPGLSGVFSTPPTPPPTASPTPTPTSGSAPRTLLFGPYMTF